MLDEANKGSLETVTVMFRIIELTQWLTDEQTGQSKVERD
jgi:hypothetical protein